MGVESSPGAIALHRTPLGAYCAAIPIVIALTAPLEALYAIHGTVKRTLAIEDMLTIEPLPWRSMIGRTYLQVRYMPFKLAAITRSKSSSEVSTGPPVATMPMLLCRISTRPARAMWRSTAALTAEDWVMSHASA
ncbi:hypothetical protein FQZ97_959400 [compost metagenome]